MGYISQNLFNLVREVVPIVCVDISIVHNNKVLLVYRKDKPAQNQWWVPGGALFKNESLKDCAKRKAHEEVGLVCKAGEMVHVDETIFPDGPWDIPVHSVNFCFKMYMKSLYPEVKLDDHHAQYKWIGMNDELEELDPYVKYCVVNALNSNHINTSKF